jgi:hypothetical protein
VVDELHRDRPNQLFQWHGDLRAIGAGRLSHKGNVNAKGKCYLAAAAASTFACRLRMRSTVAEGCAPLLRQ